MGKHWVRALKPLSRHTLGGGYISYQPGDWFECHNQEMRDLLARGMIDTTSDALKEEFDLSDAGVLARSNTAPLPGIKQYGMGFEYRGGKLELPWELTLLWAPRERLAAFGAALGMTRIASGKADDVAWEMAAPLHRRIKTIGDTGSPAEKEKTLALLGDLRIPAYDTGVVWVRRTPATEEVIQLWQEELDAGADEAHAFLRVLYSHPVLLCTLPADWIGQWAWA
jgi:hypothetical protein